MKMNYIFFRISLVYTHTWKYTNTHSPSSSFKNHDSIDDKLDKDRVTKCIQHKVPALKQISQKYLLKCTVLKGVHWKNLFPVRLARHSHSHRPREALL